MKVGMRKVLDTVEKAGVKTKLEPNLSLALGSGALTPLEVASAYSTFARGGVQMDPILIRKITDTKGRILEINKPIAKQSLPEIYVSQLVSVLEDVVRMGTGALANIPDRTIAGKTGTADGSRDIWFIGFTPDHAMSVWCGNETNNEVASRYATGGSTPAWVWREVMTRYYAERPTPARPFAYSENYKLVAVDPLTGLLATDDTPDPVYKRFYPGTEPTEYAPSAGGTPNKPKSKDDEDFQTVKKAISDEDRQLRKNTSKEGGTPARLTPQPKQFKIESTNKSESSNQEGGKVLETHPHE
jgi:penicillin-binding protein 1A